jgi:hypothetical protein
VLPAKKFSLTLGIALNRFVYYSVFNSMPRNLIYIAISQIIFTDRVLIIQTVLVSRQHILTLDQSEIEP